MHEFWWREKGEKMDKKYPPIIGKCKERLDNGTCLGCNRLELYEFTGDDNCPLFRDEEPKQVEINEKGEIKWLLLAKTKKVW